MKRNKLSPAMTDARKKEITDMCKSFTKGFADTIGSINGSGWLIVDPLSAYLNACEIKNTLHEIPVSDKYPQVLIMTFEDGSQFIPAGADLKVVNAGFENWMWI